MSMSEAKGLRTKGLGKWRDWPKLGSCAGWQQGRAALATGMREREARAAAKAWYCGGCGGCGGWGGGISGAN